MTKYLFFILFAFGSYASTDTVHWNGGLPRTYKISTDDTVRWYEGLPNGFLYYGSNGPTVGLTISVQPQSVTKYIGEIDTFTTTAINNNGTIHYQWYVNGHAMGGDSSKYITPTLPIDSNGLKIWCHITDNDSSKYTDTAFATVYDTTMAIYGMYGYEQEFRNLADSVYSIGERWNRVNYNSNIAMSCSTSALKKVNPVIQIGDQYVFNDTGAFRDTLTRAVQTYGPNGSFWRSHSNLKPLPCMYWQICNEPNGNEYLKPMSGMTLAKTYYLYLKVANRVLKAYDSRIKIIGMNTAGGMRYTSSTWEYIDSTEATWWSFIKKVDSLGGLDYIDIIGTHPYGMNWGLGRFMGPEEGGLKEGNDSLKAELARYGKTGMPIWYSEIGYAMTYPAMADLTEQKQSDFMIRHYTMSAADGVINLNQMFITDVDLGDGNRAFGMWIWSDSLHTFLTRQMTKSIRYMISILPDPTKTFSEKMITADSVYAYRFGNMMVAWTTKITDTSAAKIFNRKHAWTVKGQVGADLSCSISGDSIVSNLSSTPRYFYQGDTILPTRISTGIWNGTTSDMNLVTNWTGLTDSIYPGDTLIANSGSVGMTATKNLSCAKLITTSGYSGAVSMATYTLTTTAGGVVFNHTGTLNLGAGFTSSGVGDSLKIGAGVGTITVKTCRVTWAGTSGIIRVLKSVSFLDLTLGNAASLMIDTSNSSISEIGFYQPSGGVALTLGNNATLTINKDKTYFFMQESGTLYSLGIGYVFNGTALRLRWYPVASKLTIAIPPINYTGTSILQLGDGGNYDSTIYNFTGRFNAPNATLNLFGSNTNLHTTVNLGDTLIIAKSQWGALSGGIFTLNAGSSINQIGIYDGTTWNNATTTINLQSSKTYITGTCTFGALGTVNQGSATVDMTTCNIPVLNGQSVSIGRPEGCQPLIDSLSPSSGIIGSQITINGSNFYNYDSVFLNGIRMTYDIVGSTQMKFYAPTNSIGTYQVIVKDTSSRSDTANWTYNNILDSASIRSKYKQVSGFTTNYLHVSSSDSAIFNSPCIVRDSVVYDVGSIPYGLVGSSIESVHGYTLTVKLNGLRNTPRVINRGGKIRWR
jgi:hypothetical protein